VRYARYTSFNINGEHSRMHRDKVFPRIRYSVAIKISCSIISRHFLHIATPASRHENKYERDR